MICLVRNFPGTTKAVEITANEESLQRLKEMAQIKGIDLKIEVFVPNTHHSLARRSIVFHSIVIEVKR